MLAYIIRRLLLLIPVLLIVGVIVFTLIHLTPGDPASVMLGRDATQEQKEALRERLGLNEPFLSSSSTGSGGVLRLDFGESLFIGQAGHPRRCWIAWNRPSCSPSTRSRSRS